MPDVDDALQIVEFSHDEVKSWENSFKSKKINLRTLKKLSMTSIVRNFEKVFNVPTHLNSISLLPITLRQEFLDFIACFYCFHGAKSNLAHLALRLVSSKTLTLNVRNLFEKDGIVPELEKSVVQKLFESSWRLQVLIVENLPDIFLQPFQPTTSLRQLEIWSTELNDNYIEMIARNAPNLVILKCRLDENLTTVDSLHHLKWLKNLEEFVVIGFQNCDHRLCNLLDEILLYLPHLKVACAKAEYDDSDAVYHSLEVNHFIPLGYGELPLEHLIIGPQNIISATQAKMVPKLKTLSFNYILEDVQPSILSTLLDFHNLENLFFCESSTQLLIECLHVYGNQLQRLSIDSPPEDFDLFHALSLCPRLEELYIKHYEFNDHQLFIIPKFEAMSSLLAVTFKCSGNDLPRGLLPSLLLAPSLKVVHLSCLSVPTEDLTAVNQMAKTGAIKNLRSFNLGVSDLKSEAYAYGFFQHHLVQCVSGFCPNSFPIKPNCCSV